ncbi:hypothetical protein Leryth_002529 [Lithospermum erythrorhizon]|nr:hypothetical protein Leryth_002529 [Lithospermum erythrorhizon]
MITRSKLVEQLRDYQIRSQQKCPALTIFSSKPHLKSWVDVAVAISFASLFVVLLLLSYLTLYLRHYWISFSLMCLGIFIPVRFTILRRKLARKKEGRLSLPLSM